MTILITAEGEYISESAERPLAGKRYYLEDMDTYTPPMRRLLESLIQIAHKSGKFSVDTMDIHTFRKWWMVTRYPSLQRFRYVYGGCIQYADTVDDIPEDVLLAFNDGNSVIERDVRSSTTLNKQEFSVLIDNTIDAMQGAGIDTPKFHDIIAEITRNKLC